MYAIRSYYELALVEAYAKQQGLWFTPENEPVFTKTLELDMGKRVPVAGKPFTIGHGDVMIAAITSCTNTSNPSVLVAAGLLAQKAVDKGLSAKPWVKTSLASYNFV